MVSYQRTPAVLEVKGDVGGTAFSRIEFSIPAGPFGDFPPIVLKNIPIR
jgi:hypothetical protein